MEAKALRELLIRVEAEAKARGWARLAEQSRLCRSSLTEPGATVIKVEFRPGLRQA